MYSIGFKIFHFPNGITNDKRFEACHYISMLYKLLIALGINNKFLENIHETNKIRYIILNIIKLYLLLNNLNLDEIKFKIINESIINLMNSFIYFKEKLNININTVKIHKLIHYMEQIKLLGIPSLYSSGIN